MSVGLSLLCSVRSYNDSESHSSGLLSIVSELDSALLSSSIPPSIPPLPYSHALYFICLNRVGFLHYFRFFGWFSCYFHLGLSRMPSLVLRADEHGSLVTEETEASASDNQLG